MSFLFAFLLNVLVVRFLVSSLDLMRYCFVYQDRFGLALSHAHRRIVVRALNATHDLTFDDFNVLSQVIRQVLIQLLIPMPHIERLQDCPRHFLAHE